MKSVWYMAGVMGLMIAGIILLVPARSPQSAPRQPAAYTSSLAAKDVPSPTRRYKLPSRAPNSITINWVGDIAFSTQHGLPRGGAYGALRPLRRALSFGHLTFGNLEGTLGSGGTTKCSGSANCYAFQAPPGYARGFAKLGFDLMNHANNHSFDAGAAGQRETLQTLSRARVRHTGRPGQITYMRARGLRVAVLGFAPYIWSASLLDIAAARRSVRRAGRRADLVVVLMHAGAEGSDKTHVPFGNEYAYGENRGNTRKFSHAVIAAGADLVLGSGPHVLRGIERYRNRLIAYSLGNFAGPNTFASGGILDLTGVLRVKLHRKGYVLGGRWISALLQGRGIPRKDNSHSAARFVRNLSKADFGNHRYRMRSNGVIIPRPLR